MPDAQEPILQQGYSDPVQPAARPAGSHEERRAYLTAAFRGGEGRVGLNKARSNLFRNRSDRPPQMLDAGGLDRVLEVAPEHGYLEAEGMAPFGSLVEAALHHQALPAVVPQFRSITLGGAVAGTGLEATSFRHGLVHHGLLEMDVLVGDGRILTCRPDNEHSDLFFGFPNSYGTLGYALRLRQRLVPAQPYVWVQHRRHRDAESCLADLAEHCAGTADFVDAVAFSPSELYVSVGRFVVEAPYLSDYRPGQGYLQSIPKRSEDYLGARDYLWRWESDGLCGQGRSSLVRPLLRRLNGRPPPDVPAGDQIMRLKKRMERTRAWSRLLGLHTEPVVQQMHIPLAAAGEFLAFLFREIRVLPLWLCPVRAPEPGAAFRLYPLRDDTLYVSFGLCGAVKSRRKRPTGFLNRRIERKVADLGGLKSLHAENFYKPEDFWAHHNLSAYEALKRRYDPEDRFGNLYRKCVPRL